jgi:methylmalonyl-CoA mutase C-terminal domain/subunit
VRVLLAKIGLDGHDRGVKVVARALRDSGMEVIYTGLHQTPEQVVEAAIQEDVDVLGVSILSGAHMSIFRRIFDILGARPGIRFQVLAGGVMPDEDAQALRAMGVTDVVGQDSPPERVIEAVRSCAAETAVARG